MSAIAAPSSLLEARQSLEYPMIDAISTSHHCAELVPSRSSTWTPTRTPTQLACAPGYGT